MILVYFIVLQTFFQSRKNLKGKFDDFDEQFQIEEENHPEFSDENNIDEDDRILNEMFKGDIYKLEKNEVKHTY